MKKNKTYLVTLTVNIPIELVADTAREAENAALAHLMGDAFTDAELKAVEVEILPRRRVPVRRLPTSPD